MTKELDNYIPRADLLAIIADLEGRLLQCGTWLADALEALENEADMIATPDGDQPNGALQALSAIKAEIDQAPFCLRHK